MVLSTDTSHRAQQTIQISSRPQRCTLISSVDRPSPIRIGPSGDQLSIESVLLPLAAFTAFIAPSALGWQARWVEGGVLQHNWQRDEGLLLDMGNNNVMKLFIMCNKPH
eukprot:scaffold797_cov37-Cyclotella_meneghiniana.AAC.1